jgi:hypothetical protein
MAVPPLGRNPNSSSAADCIISSGMAQKDDFRYIWNKLLLQEVVAHSYANCILYARDILPLMLTGCSCFKYLDVFLSYIPDYAKLKSNMWTELALEVFRNIQNRELQVFPVYILSHEMLLENEMHLENDMDFENEIQFAYE